MRTASSTFARIATVLGRTRSRIRLRAGLIALGWAIAIVGVLALIVVLLAGALEAGSWLRGVAAVLLTGALTAVGWRFFILEFWRSRSDAAVAAHLEAGVPELRDGLLACVELEGAPDRADAALRSALQQQVAARLDTADVNAVTPFRPARKAWIGAGVAAIVWGGAVLIAPGAISRGLATLAPGAGLVGPDGALQTGPLVGDLTLTLHYPKHTGRQAKVIPNSAGDFLAPKGTRVEISATTLEPAQEVSLSFGKPGEGTQLPLTVKDARDARGEFVVSEASAWRFMISTTGGEALIEALDRHIRLEPDNAPEVALQLPSEDLELEDLRRVAVQYSARDDFGLDKVNIVIALAADPEHPEKIEQIGVKGKAHAGRDEVDLSIIQAQPGDRIALFVEAWDNHSIDGAQRGVSATRYITVHSPQEKHYELSERLRALVDLLLDALADRLEMDDWAGEGLPARLAALNVTSEKAAKGLAAIVDDMVDDPLTPKEVRLALTGRLGSLEKSIAAEAALLNTENPALEARTPAAVAQGKGTNDGVVDQLEQAIVLVEAMVARLALEDMQALVEEMRSAQERLRDMIKQYKQNPDDAALKSRIMREVQRIRKRMDEIRRRMAQMRKKMPEEFLNLDGMKKGEMADSLKAQADQLKDLEKMLEEGRMDEALAALDEMEKALEEMNQVLDKDLNDLHKNTNPEMQKALSELMDQTRDLMARQQEVNKETQALAEKEREQMRKMLEEQLKEKLAGVQQKGRELEKQVAEIKPERLSNPSARELGHVEQRVTELNSALERKAIMEALEMGERTLDRLDRVERMERLQSTEQPKIGKSQQLAKDITAELAQMAQDARQQMQKAQQGQSQKSQELGQKQQKLSDAAQKLGQRIQDGAKKIPGMGDKPMQSLQQAQKSMRDAAQRLRGQQPGQAQPGQQQAMSSLQQIMDGLKRANQPQKAQRKQGRKMSHERVNVPKGDDHRGPDAFRKDLLDAMKDAPPDAYRDQVKRYYEALIK